MHGRGSYLPAELGSMADLRRDGSMGFFYRAMLLIAFFAPLALVGSPAAAAPRHYDCSKPGNAEQGRLQERHDYYGGHQRLSPPRLPLRR